MLQDRLLRAIDWFVPESLRGDTGTFWQARIFALSHLLSPVFAAPIIVFLHRADPHPGGPFWTICALSCAFGVLPFGMKITKRLRWAATCSVATLTFLSVFGSYFYGGVSSPFLPWFLTALLLGFFYLGDRPRLVLGMFAVNLLGLGVAHEISGVFPELVPVASLSAVGVISVCAATIYTSMMAVYYANVVTAQSELRREVERHVVTAAKMRRAKEDAERASEAKSVFLAKMNHHLRTPLNAVIGYSEILLEDAEADGDEAQIADLQRINGAGRHLLSLVTDVLDVGKIGAAGIELNVREFDLAAFVDDVAATCRRLVTINGNELVVDLGESLGTVVNDPTRLRQIAINLIGNAGKFTSRGTVTLRVRRAPRDGVDTVEIAIRDTGIGISPTSLARLFTDFQQAEASTAATYGGTGLGLALSRNLCRAMRGEIDVESTVGQGSTFTVRLPADVRLAGPAATAATAAGVAVVAVVAAAAPVNADADADAKAADVEAAALAVAA